jgi:hypothetical protein
MKILPLLLIVIFLVGCDTSMPERREASKSSEFLGKTFVTKLPLAYKTNLPRYDQVSRFIRLNSDTIFAEEVDRKIAEITSDCTNCMGENKLTTAIRIEYIPIGTKLSVVGEYVYHSDYGSWINGPTNIHTLILEDESGNRSEISELAFKLTFVDERFVNRELRDEEVRVLENIRSFNEHRTLNLVFCVAEWLDDPGDLGSFIRDFQLEQQMVFEPGTSFCARGYAITFETLDAYLTSEYYFNDWRLYGKWHQVEKI